MEFSKNIFLSFIEEDNEQHSLFHIRPLLSSSGPLPAHIISSFKDNGFLRIAPDKKEQFTFKERMRSLGSLCIVDLTEVEDAAGKVRPNRNYSPQFNEKHQFIIYSDVVKSLPKDLVYEVIAGEKGKPVLNCITPMCFLRSGGRIQGPYLSDSGKAAGKLISIEPDSPNIFAISLPNGQEKLFYWKSEENAQAKEQETAEKSSQEKVPDISRRYKRPQASSLTAAVGRRKRENLRSSSRLEELLSPMEAFKTAAPQVFSDDAKGEEALDCLMAIPKAQDLIMRSLNINQGENPLAAVFNKQIDGLEADRFKISLEIDKLKKDRQELFKAALEEKSALADKELKNKQRDIDSLSKKIDSLKEEHNKLVVLRDDILKQIYLSTGKSVLAKPQGEEKPATHAVQRIREHLKSAGFKTDIDEAWLLLTIMLFEDQIQLCAPALADSRAAAKAIAFSLGASYDSRLKGDKNMFFASGGNGFAVTLVSQGEKDDAPFTRLIISNKVQPFGKSYLYAAWPCFSVNPSPSKLAYEEALPCESAFDAEFLQNELKEGRLSSIPQEAADIISSIIKNMQDVPHSLLKRMFNCIMLIAPHVSGGLASAIDLCVSAYLLPYAMFSGSALNIPERILPSMPYTAKLL